MDKDPEVTKEERTLLDKLAKTPSRVQPQRQTKPIDRLGINPAAGTSQRDKSPNEGIKSPNKVIMGDNPVKITLDIAKFKGNRRRCDAIFTPGPSIDDYITNIESYCKSQGITEDADKCNALRLFTSQTEGDAWGTLHRYFSHNLKATLPYTEIVARLKEIYRSLATSNFASAAKKYRSVAFDPSNPLDLTRIVDLESSAITVVDKYLERKQYSKTADTRPIRETMAELLIAITIANDLGPKVSDAVLTDHGSNEHLFALTEKTLDYIKKNPGSVRNPEEINFLRKTSQKNTKLICPRCGNTGHKFKDCMVNASKIKCEKCDLKNDHVTSQCERNRKFREQRAAKVKTRGTPNEK